MVAKPHAGTVRVWDLPVRLFHWSLVTCFAVAWLSGEESETLHNGAGYAVLGLLAFRLIWGVVGSRHARFTDFVRGPAATLCYAGALLTGHPPRHLGHNPLGGWMIVAMLATLLVTGWSGLELLAAEGQGPLAGTAWIAPARADGDERAESDEHGGEEASGEFWEGLHEGSATLMLWLVGLHLAGVVASSLLHRENLVRAMVTGRKRAGDETAAAR